MDHIDYGFPCDVTFEIWDGGDPSTGIQGSNSAATVFIHDKEHLESVRAILVETFSTIHDFKVVVMTKQEIEGGRDD